MYKAIFQSLASAVITLFCATLIIFVLIRLAPGDPVKLLIGRPGELAVGDRIVYEERVNELRRRLGLDQSLAIQYVKWLKRLISFELGTSIHTGRAVEIEIAERLPATLLLSLTALIIQLVLGVFFGIVSALRAGKTSDAIIRFICVTFTSIPAFVFGLGLLLVFSVNFAIYEISNSASMHRLWLPAFTLGFVGALRLIRMVRANLLSELGKTYVISALSRGLSKKLVVKHALRNALLPIVTMLALSFTNLIGGAVVIESIFTWPGIGSYAMNSVLLHDYPIIQGYTVIMVSAVIVINLLVDLFYILVDPRIRNEVRGNRI